ncbi:MAG: hypothetical protein GY757_45950, partial [bacterium]|nr:hypothetical protein [bacterium]
EELLKKKGLAVKTIREGISGENTIGALNRIQRDVIDKKPDWVTIMYGTNDAFIDTRNNKGTTPRIPLEEFEVNLHRIVQILFKNNIKPILMTPIPMGKFWAAHLEPYKTGDRNFKLREYAAAVRRVAGKEGIPLVDHFARWERWQKLGKNTESWLTDGLHPNPKGHRFMAQTIGRVLTEVTEVN